tara:strand:+ start:1405 stop:1593 length:189 start_codon:yes stop_codon:yes gene_type:complete
MSKPFIDGHKYLVTGELLNKNYELIRELLDIRDPFYKGTGVQVELATNVLRIEANAQRILEP